MSDDFNVLTITNVAVPYRVDFFNEISQYVHLEVIYEQSIEQQTHRDASWFVKKDLKYDVISIRNKSNRISYFKLFKELRKHRNSVVFMMGYSRPVARAALIWLKLHKIPYVLTCDGGFVRNESFIKRSIKRFFISGASLYLSTADESDAFFQYYGADKNSIKRIPFTTLFERDILSIPPTMNEKIEIRKELNIPEKRVIISVGQFIYRKGYDVLLNACKYIDSSYGVYIIGSDATKEYLDMREQLDLRNVHFVGFKSKEELKKYYMAADLFVLPTREDVWGLVINEAMANGLPVISTNKCIACVELVKNGVNGYIVPVNDSNKLTQSIIEAMNVIENSNRMSVESLNRIRDYTIEKMAQCHYEYFSSMRKVIYHD